MDAINLLRSKYQAMRKSPNFKIFMRFGAPMFIFVVGGSFLMEEFQKVRQDYLKNKHNEELMNDVMKQKGMKINMRTEYEKIKNADTSNYRNVRGPRVYEDNLDFLRNRELQERRLAELVGKTPTSSNTAASQ